MKTEYRLARALKEMMAETPLDEISVTSLSNKCDVSRKTFYYHFHDIYDLLTLVYLNERIEGIQQVNNSSMLLDCIFNYYEKNAKFVDATLASAGRDLVKEFLYNNCYQTLLKIINNINDAKLVPLADRRNIARFYAGGMSDFAVFFFLNSKAKSLYYFKKMLSFISDDFLEEALERLEANKKK